jgi:hypothetical protein
MATITSIPIGDNDRNFPNNQSVEGGVDPRLVYDTGGQFSQEQASPGFYPNYEVRAYYLGATGLKQMPVAGVLGSTTRNVRASAPYAKKLVMWKAHRVMTKPTLPHYDSGNLNETLAWFFIVPHAPVLLPGGENYSFVVEGLYLYYLSNVPCLTDDFYSGVMPLYTAVAEDLKIQGYEFSRDLLRTLPPAPYTGTADQQFQTSDGPSTLLSGFLGVGR